jgi:threonine/homoserine/homoserine lactone efflux protein
MPDLVAFFGIAAAVICTPGPDTALTVRNTLAGGRPAGVATAAGVSLGQAFWTLAASVGLAALLSASEPVFATLRIVGGCYLIYLGAESLWRAVRPRPSDSIACREAARLAAPRAFRQGLVSNLTNPKMAAFFTSLLPQFAVNDRSTFLVLTVLGSLFATMTLVWLSIYACAIARASRFFVRRGVSRLLNGVLGAVLIALGARLATHRWAGA